MQVALLERAAAVGDDAAQICVFCSEETHPVSNPVTGSTSREDQEKNMIHNAIQEILKEISIRHVASWNVKGANGSVVRTQ